MVACSWEVIGCDDCSAYASLDSEVQSEVEAWAVNRLWEWTNQRFGPCEELVRPCRKSCVEFSSFAMPWGGGYIGLNCVKCGDSCSCREVQQVILPGPIYALTEVLVDGDEVDLSAFRVDNYTILVRQDGGVLPTCQDLGKTPDEVGTWQISYLLGEEVPPGGGLVAGILACEYAKSLCGDNSCRLPKRVSSVQRQGIVINNNSSRSTEQGITGIFEIDDWVMTANKPNRRSVATSPDVPRPRITTWTYAES